MNPRFRSDILVLPNPEATTGSDEVMARAAWAVPPQRGDWGNAAKELKDRYGKDGTSEGLSRVLGACMRLRHNSPFEHGLLSVYAEMPGVVWWQLTRQRFMSLDTEDFSFSLESGRYKHPEPEFYTPPGHRFCVEPKGFMPMRPEFVADPEASSALASEIRAQAISSWESYTSLLNHGVAREVARLVLPNWSLYCDGYVTAKPLSWLQFFSKRNRTTDTEVPTYPQWEIEEFARKCEVLFSERYPATHAAFAANGRVAP